MNTLDLQSLSQRQRWQAFCFTQRDVWLTAAIMNLFLGPAGLLFGAAALLAMRGLGAAIRVEQVELTEQRLRHGKRLVCLGLGFTALLLMVTLGMALPMFMHLSALFQTGHSRYVR